MTELERRLARPPASAPFDARAATTVLVQRAIEAGLADVAYGWLDSPLGKLIVAVTPRGLVSWKGISPGRFAGSTSPSTGRWCMASQWAS